MLSGGAEGCAVNKTLTRRGFVSMLASVPIAIVAVPKIFLPPESKVLVAPLSMVWELEEDYDKYGAHPFPGTHAHLRHILDLLGIARYVVREDMQRDYTVEIEVPQHHVTQHTLNALEYCRCPGVRFDLRPLV